MAPTVGDTPKHFLYPCTIFAHREEHWVSTVLGSCVAVTLFDRQATLGGMNHFMLPLWNGEGLPTPKYGNIAMEKLLERVLGLGARRERLVAQVFGGASVLGDRRGPFEIGARNVMVAREILQNHGIQVAAANVGGEVGLRLLFNTRTGAVRAERLRFGDQAERALPDGRPELMKGRA